MKRIILLMLVLIVLLPAFSSAEETILMYIADGDETSVTLYEEASLQSCIRGNYGTGTPVWVIQSENDWAYVRIGKSTGYVGARYLTEICPDTPVKTAMVHSDGYLNLRLQPTTESASLNRLRDGQQLVILGETADGWSFVSVPASGQNGYVMAEYVEYTPQTPVQTMTLCPLNIGVYEGVADSRRLIELTVDEEAQGFGIEITQDVDYFCVNEVTWLEDVTVPQFFPLYTSFSEKAGTAVHIRVYLPDVTSNIALTCQMEGVFQTWYVIQSGENGEYLLIPAQIW